MNLEFIAAVTVEDNKKYLLLIDQHAVDERIRYEQLLEGLHFFKNLIKTTKRIFYLF